jgi:hypothetical protein
VADPSEPPSMCFQAENASSILVARSPKNPYVERVSPLSGSLFPVGWGPSCPILARSDMPDRIRLWSGSVFDGPA